MTRVRRRNRPRSGFAAHPVPGSMLAFSAIWFLAIAVAPRWGWLSWPLHPGPRLPDVAAAAVLAVLAASRYAWFRRSAAGHDRRSLRAVAAQRAEGVWLNRADRQAFSISARGPRWLRVWMITRIPEDSAWGDDEDDDSGERPVLTETYMIVPGAGSVFRDDAVILADPEAGTARELPVAGTGRLRGTWRRYRSAKTGLGFVAVRPDEVAAVLAQLRASERIGRRA